MVILMKPLNERLNQELIIIEIAGRMAHFRKFYSNSSSLSYSFPPRTVITGMIAGILGRERDGYYQEFSTESCSVAVAIANPQRRISQVVNYIRTKSKSELDGSGGPTQIPMEILLGEGEKVRYRVFFEHKNAELIHEVAERIRESRYIYPPYLGISEFTAVMDFVALLGPEDMERRPSEEKVYIDTVINTDHLQDRGIYPGERDLKILKEKMTIEFAPGREINRTASFIFESSGRSLPVKLQNSYRQVNISGDITNITFMDGGS